MPVVRLLQAFPKLAVVFFVVHLTIMIYTIFGPSKPAIKASEDLPPGVAQKIPLAVDGLRNAYKAHNSSVTMPHKDLRGPKNNETDSRIMQNLFGQRNADLNSNNDGSPHVRNGPRRGQPVR